MRHIYPENLKEFAVDFPTYLGQAWTDHATQPQQVADGFSTGAALISAPEQITQLAGLIAHVMGEHLGQWEAGEMHLNSLRSNPYYSAGSEGEKAILRSVAALKLAGGNGGVLASFSPSDSIRILAVAASALNDKNIERARELFGQALTLAEPGLQKTDPAARALAVTGNNLACTLEERETRTPSETKLMISAAHTARKFWEVAGGISEVTAAEYRLAMTYIAAGDGERAQEHGRKAADLAVKNSLGGVDLFYAFEALALSERARGNFPGFNNAAEKCRATYDKLSPDDKQSCGEAMRKLGLQDDRTPVHP